MQTRLINRNKQGINPKIQGIYNEDTSNIQGRYYGDTRQQDDTSQMMQRRKQDEYKRVITRLQNSSELKYFLDNLPDDIFL